MFLQSLYWEPGNLLDMITIMINVVSFMVGIR